MVYGHYDRDPIADCFCDPLISVLYTPGSGNGKISTLGYQGKPGPLMDLARRCSRAFQYATDQLIRCRYGLSSCCSLKLVAIQLGQTGHLPTYICRSLTNCEVRCMGPILHLALICRCCIMSSRTSVKTLRSDHMLQQTTSISRIRYRNILIYALREHERAPDTFEALL